MNKPIRRACVIGAGVMGQGIAAHFANAGIEVLLLDIVPPDLKDADKAPKAARNAFAAGGLDKALKARPAAFFHKQNARLVSVGNSEDDLAKVSTCDLVIEAVLECIDVRHVVVTGLGDMLGFPKSLLVNFVVRHFKKMVPAWDLPGHVTFREALARGAAYALKPVTLTHDDLAYLQYTGGTTGVAKGAMLTHGNIVANLQQAHAWISPYVREGEEVIITALPLYHIFSLTANCLTFFKIGASNVLITNPRDIRGFVAGLGKYPFTVITGVNTLFNALLAGSSGCILRPDSAAQASFLRP